MASPFFCGSSFNFDVEANTDWPKGLPYKLRDVIDIDSAAELEDRRLDWERYCDDQRRRAEGIADLTP